MSVDIEEVLSRLFNAWSQILPEDMPRAEYNRRLVGLLASALRNYAEDMGGCLVLTLHPSSPGAEFNLEFPARLRCEYCQRKTTVVTPFGPRNVCLDCYRRLSAGSAAAEHISARNGSLPS